MCSLCKSLLNLNRGPEIWKQTNGQVDAVAVTPGTGGTMSGVFLYLTVCTRRRERNFCF